MPETPSPLAPAADTLARRDVADRKQRRLIAFWLILASAGFASLLWLDDPVHRLSQSLASWQGIAHLVTQLGAEPGIVLALLLGLLGGRRIFLAVFAVLIADGVVVNVLKHLIGRGRPYLAPDAWLFHGPSWAGDLTSMPSGHTAVAAAMVVLVSRFAPRWRALAWAVTILVAASRLILDMHWMSDVIAGGLVGSITAHGTLRLIHKWLPSAGSQTPASRHG